VSYSITQLADDIQRITLEQTDYGRIVHEATPLLRRWMVSPDLSEDQMLPCEGLACGHLIHRAEDGSFFIISVVFPPGTSSGVHYHGSWGVIGVLAGIDEETKYRRTVGPPIPSAGEECALEQVARTTYPAGSITKLLPPDEAFHRVRAAGPDIGLSLHILGGTPQSHPHLLCHPETRRLVNYPMATLLDRVPPNA
jgi:predicted metal-dependent enzyme (double-stranded beta helix superfamily)